MSNLHSKKSGIQHSKFGKCNNHVFSEFLDLSCPGFEREIADQLEFSCIHKAVKPGSLDMETTLGIPALRAKHAKLAGNPDAADAGDQISELLNFKFLLEAETIAELEALGDNHIIVAAGSIAPKKKAKKGSSSVTENSKTQMELAMEAAENFFKKSSASSSSMG